MRADAEYHVAVQLRFPRDEIAHHVDADHLLVHRVGLDVLAVERDAFRRCVQPLQRLDQPSGARRRRDLRRSEMSDGRATELAVQAEQRHQIDHRQRLGGNNFEVTQIGRIESGGGQQVGEQLLVGFCTLPGSVFVEFDRDERRLGLATEAGIAQACGSPSLRW